MGTQRACDLRYPSMKGIPASPGQDRVYRTFQLRQLYYPISNKLGSRRRTSMVKPPVRESRHVLEALESSIDIWKLLSLTFYLPCQRS